MLESKGSVARPVYVCYTTRMAKTKVIPVRLDAEEWSLIERAAAKLGQTPSAYLRHAAVTTARRELHSHPVVAAERKRISEASDPPAKS